MFFGGAIGPSQNLALVNNMQITRQIPVLGMGPIDVIRLEPDKYRVEFCGQTPSRRGAAELYPNAETAADQGVLFAKRLMARAIDSLNI